MKVLKFSADWCQPCKMLSRIIEDAPVDGVEIVNIDIDNEQETAIRYGIRGVPTLVVLDEEGKEVRRKVGSMTESDYKAFVTG